MSEDKPNDKENDANPDEEDVENEGENEDWLDDTLNRAEDDDSTGDEESSDDTDEEVEELLDKEFDEEKAADLFQDGEETEEGGSTETTEEDEVEPDAKEEELDEDEVKEQLSKGVEEADLLDNTIDSKEEEESKEIVPKHEVEVDEEPAEPSETLPVLREDVGKSIQVYLDERARGEVPEDEDFLRHALQEAVSTASEIQKYVEESEEIEESEESGGEDWLFGDMQDVGGGEFDEDTLFEDDEFFDEEGISEGEFTESRTWEAEDDDFAVDDFEDVPGSRETETERTVPEGEEGERKGKEEGKFTIEDLFKNPFDERTGFEGFEGYVEEQRYWLYKPFSYASILRNTEDENRIYYVVEPELSEFEKVLKRELSERLRDMLRYEEVPDYSDATRAETRSHILRDKVLDVISEYGISRDSEILHKVLYYVERDFIRYGRIDPLMNDPYIEDISCNGYDVPIYVYHREYGSNLESNIRFKKRALNSFIIRLAQQAGKHINTANPQVDASLPGGSRAQLTLGEDVTTRGSSFTIRKFKEVPLTPIDLIELGTFSIEEMAYFWLAIENRKSLIFAGGTASGKTTSMNAISLFIPPRSKVVTIEDTRELTLPHNNWVPAVTRQKFGGTFAGEEEAGGRGQVTMYQLLRAALRQRPQYLLVGEVRGKEAHTLFQAMSTGHTTYSTLHADDVDSVIQRLTSDPINVPRTMLKSLDIISIQEQRDVNNERVRRNTTVAEVGRLDEDQNLETYSYFDYDARSDTFVQTGTSRVLDDIRRSRGWTKEELDNNLEEREKILQYLLNSEIRGYRAVTRVLQTYMIDPDRIIRGLEEGTLEPEQFQQLDAVTV